MWTHTGHGPGGGLTRRRDEPIQAATVKLDDGPVLDSWEDAFN